MVSIIAFLIFLFVGIMIGFSLRDVKEQKQHDGLIDRSTLNKEIDAIIDEIIDESEE